MRNVNQYGLVSVLRFNFQTAPFNNPALRRAVLSVWSFWNMAIVPGPPAARAQEYGLL